MHAVLPGLIVYRTTGGVDAINEYSARLADALRDEGLPVRYVSTGSSDALAVAGEPAWILLQYNPFSYGRWGVAPRLISDLIALRRRTGALLAISIHEPWGRVTDWRSALMTAYQQAQLRMLLQIADTVIVATEAYSRAIRRPAIHIPVGSNVTPLPVNGTQARLRLGLDERLVMTLFGTGHPSRALDHAEAAIAAVCEQRGPGALTVQNLGIGSPRLTLPVGVQVVTPGRLEADELSLRLHASDVLLLPFTDGVSSRRTTLMAGLAHGVPVAGLHGTSTDRIFLEHDDALTLTPFGDIRRFAHAVVALCDSEPTRRALGKAGRSLYHDEFDWPVIARRVHAALADQRGGRRSTTIA